MCTWDVCACELWKPHQQEHRGGASLGGRIDATLPGVLNSGSCAPFPKMDHASRRRWSEEGHGWTRS